MRKLQEEEKALLRECKIGAPEGVTPPAGWKAVGYSPSCVVYYHCREGWRVEKTSERNK
jgi:hypothetical protein